MAKVETFDDLILGGGKGGKSLAVALANAGKKVALVENGQIGGTCINQACIPTKTMVASAKVVDLAKKAASFGVALQPAGDSIKAIIERKRRVVKGMVDAHWNLFTTTKGLELVIGSGRFIDERIISVNTDHGESRLLTAERIYINSGSKTTIPTIDGLDSINYLTSRTIMELEVLPEHLVILGAGYIALEFAQIFARLGSKVTVLMRGRFLPKEDEDIAQVVRTILEEDGVQFLRANILGVRKHGASIEVKTDAEGYNEITASHLLVAIGRTPNTADLNLDATKVQLDKRGNITVDHSLKTTAPGVWAIGDCNGGPLFTHVSWDDFRILRDNILHNSNRTTANRIIPYTLFIDPELGRVGLTEEEARSRGLDILVAKIPASKIPRANTAGETQGLLKAVIDRQTNLILGCSLLCHSAGEVMSVVQMAMIGKVPYTTVRDTIFTHPTMAESLNLLFANIEP